jgi:ABC-type Mn2+/Zn2+ transport system ATPase subunit
MAYLPQREALDWDFPLTVRGLVEMGRYPQLGPWKPFRREDREAVDEALEAMDIRDLEGRHISALSGGQQQRAFIARALAQGPHVLLLDEPFNGLDRTARETLVKLLRELTEAGRLVVASHHDVHTAGEIFDQALLLKGHPVAFGPVEDVLTDAHLAEAFR